MPKASSTGLLSLMEAAKVLGCSRVWVWRLVNDGRLPAVRVGRGWAVAAAAVERLKEERK
jgi:excisionase family DNA binding protein